jgi:transposase InsO family protein
VTQQARQFAWTLPGRAAPFRFLIRDRDQKFTTAFDNVFRSDGLEILRTPIRAPQANGVAERFVRTARAECLDWMLIANERHLERTLKVFVEHYNGHRPHRALGLVPPAPVPSTWTAASDSGARVHRRDRLGGLLHEYTLAS